MRTWADSRRKITANEALGRFADLFTTGQIPEYRGVVDTTIAWEARSWPNTTADEYALDPSNGLTTSSQVLRWVAHGFANTHRVGDFDDQL